MGAEFTARGGRGGLGGQQPTDLLDRAAARLAADVRRGRHARTAAKSLALTEYLKTLLLHLADERTGRSSPLPQPRSAAASCRCGCALARWVQRAQRTQPAAARCSMRSAAAAWSATGASPTSFASRPCRFTTASRKCCAGRAPSAGRDGLRGTDAARYTVIGAGPVGTLMALMLAQSRSRREADRAPSRSAQHAAGARPFHQSGAGRARHARARARRTCRSGRARADADAGTHAARRQGRACIPALWAARSRGHLRDEPGATEPHPDRRRGRLPGYRAAIQHALPGCRCCGRQCGAAR